MKILLSFLILFSSHKHPIALTSTLLLLSIFIAKQMSNTIKSSWMSFILILIMLGGLLILFTYISSLASNETFQMSKMFLILPFVLCFFNLNETKQMEVFLEKYTQSIFLTSNFNSIFSMMYLLFTLLIVMEIISFYNTPLRPTK